MLFRAADDGSLRSATLPPVSPSTPPADAFPFDAVLFDLDGTLVATDRFWPDAARAGAVRAFAELGIERELPTRADWMSLVGRPLAEGFDDLLGDLDEPARRQVQARCEEAEHELLRDGRAAPLPGVLEVLAALRAAGVRTGIASNCGQGYLDAMMNGLGLARWIEEARCLDSPGIHDKAGMIEDLLLTFDTRRAVMVGDRAGDRDAAWANGVPHVHLARGYAVAGEHVAAEATIEGMDALPATLSGRTAFLDELVAELPTGLSTGLATARGAVVGVSGTRASGKTLFAAELARGLRRRGCPVRVAALADYAVGTPRDAADPFTGAFDLERLEREVLAPESGELVLLEGPFLVHPRLATNLDHLIWLDGSEEVRLRRLAGRDARMVGPVPIMRARAEDLPLERELVAACPPARLGARIIDQENLLVLRRVGPDGLAR